MPITVQADPTGPETVAGTTRRAGDRIPGHIGASVHDDSTLIAAVAAGDPAALDQLFLRYRRDAFGAAFAMVRDPHVAEDAVHDAFLSVWRSAKSFQPERGPAKAWIVAIARHAAIDRLRASQVARRQQTALAHAENLARGNDDVAAMATMAAEARRLHSALALLPPSQRHAVELAFFAGLSHSQIAERTEAPLGTVKGRIRLGLQRLRQDLGESVSPVPTLVTRNATSSN